MLRIFRYYRSKLPENEKSAYDSIVEGISTQKKRINVPVFPENDFGTVLLAVRLDHPELFWFGYGGVYYKYTGYYEYEPVYTLEGEKLRRQIRQLENAAAPIIISAMRLKVGERFRFLHDRLARETEYTKYLEEQTELYNRSHNVLGALIDRKCVCEGYAKAYKYLADRTGLQCAVIFGEAVHPDGSSGGHAWNMIREGNSLYHVDVTHDIMIGGRNISHAFFRLSTKEIEFNHNADKDFILPVCRISGSILKKVGGTRALIDFMREESLGGKQFSEVRLTKENTMAELKRQIENNLSPADWQWYNRLDYYYYTNGTRTLCITWK